MKYLKLTNTKECLKLAECLIGSDTFKVIDMVPYESQGELLGVCGDNFLIRESSEETDYGFVNSFVMIPMDSIKLNPFKCCEHSIPVIVDRGIFGKEKRNDQNELLHIVAEGRPFELDFNSLCKGAELLMFNK